MESSSSGMITRRRSVDDDEGISPKDVSLLSPIASPTLSMEEGGDNNINNNNAYEPPGKTRRRRSNTFHGESPSKESPNAQVSLQPINFGEGHSAVQFSPGSMGSGGETGSSTTRSRGLSSSFTAGMGSHTLSSGSLYSEFGSETGSHSPEGGLGYLDDGLFGGTRTTYQQGFTTAQKTSSTATMDKRQKRLERNRESARASRKRRKAYLEELELKVNRMSEEMDKGRMEHASVAVQTIRNMRLEKLNKVEQMLEGKPTGSRSGIQHNVTSQTSNSSSLEEQIQPLMSNLSRTSDELQIVQTFMKQQLMSLVQPTEIKYLLWLSLQNDQLFRGGRSPSERLSAARIGERVSFFLYNRVCIAHT